MSVKKDSLQFYNSKRFMVRFYSRLCELHYFLIPLLLICLFSYRRFPSNEFAEKITTSSGEIMGGFETTDKGNESTDITEIGGQRIVVDVDSALRAREGKS